jgi:hypothetical protein
VISQSAGVSRFSIISFLDRIRYTGIPKYSVRPCLRTSRELLRSKSRLISRGQASCATATRPGTVRGSAFSGWAVGTTAAQVFNRYMPATTPRRCHVPYYASAINTSMLYLDEQTEIRYTGRSRGQDKLVRAAPLRAGAQKQRRRTRSAWNKYTKAVKNGDPTRSEGVQRSASVRRCPARAHEPTTSR